MAIAWLNLILFIIAATALLGSPGPGIAALVSVGRMQGFRRGLRFYGGLQIGLAAAAAVSAGGLFAIIRTLPLATAAMSLAATAYLGLLAWRIATAPVAGDPVKANVPGSALGGLLLGLSNPKAYLAFASLMASYGLATDPSLDAGLKWALCVAIMVVVDLCWLWAAAALGRLVLAPRQERALNRLMGGAILLAALMALL